MLSQVSIVDVMLLDAENDVSWRLYPEVEREIRNFAMNITDINLDLYFKQVRNMFVQNSPYLLLGVVVVNGKLRGYMSGIYGPSLSGDVLFIHFAKMNGYLDKMVCLIDKWIDRAKKCGINFSGKIQFVTSRSSIAWMRLIKRFCSDVVERNMITINYGR